MFMLIKVMHCSMYARIQQNAHEGNTVEQKTLAEQNTGELLQNH